MSSFLYQMYEYDFSSIELAKSFLLDIEDDIVKKNENLQYEFTRFSITVDNAYERVVIHDDLGWDSKDEEVVLDTFLGCLRVYIETGEKLTAESFSSRFNT